MSFLGGRFLLRKPKPEVSTANRKPVRRTRGTPRSNVGARRFDRNAADTMTLDEYRAHIRERRAASANRREAGIDRHTTRRDRADRDVVVATRQADALHVREIEEDAARVVRDEGRGGDVLRPPRFHKISRCNSFASHARQIALRSVPSCLGDMVSHSALLYSTARIALLP